MTNDLRARADALVAEGESSIAACQRVEDLDMVSPWVTVEPGVDGAPQVTVKQGWETSLTPAGLGVAVSAAIHAFLVARTEQPLPVTSWQPRVDGADLTAALERINLALDAAMARLREVSSRAVAEPEPAAQSRTGQVRVFAEHGSVVVVIDPAWAHGKSGSAVSGEINELIYQTLEKVSDGPKPMSEDPLMADPQAALDWLRSVL